MIVKICALNYAVFLTTDVNISVLYFAMYRRIISTGCSRTGSAEGISEMVGRLRQAGRVADSSSCSKSDRRPYVSIIQ